MFTDFFLLLRAGGIDVSTQEWFTLLEGLKAGLHDCALTGFYRLARAVLVKSEADYDKFDRAFLAYFKDVRTFDELPPELLEWLSSPVGADGAVLTGELPGLDELRRRFAERLGEQTERHDGGSHWIGTGGTSPFGNSGQRSGGIRVGGEGRRRSALQIAGERSYRDFREDAALEDRQFQLAFRRLRQYSAQGDGPKDELKLDETIRETCDNAGSLKLVFGRPRRNAVKLMLLFDSGGSMWSYADLCASLFQSVNKSVRFRDLRTYYFHNCIYDRLYTTPSCADAESVETEWVLGSLKGDYRVIAVGDASMAPYELLSPGGNIYYYRRSETPGIEWIGRLKKRYRRMIWLNPVDPSEWERGYGGATIGRIGKLVPMYHLSVDGLREGLGRLMRDRA